jgi:alpha-tubulin suppressor-like RCC1 family protein
MSHACVIGADGNAWCWGNNVFGALGDGTEEAHSDDPVRVVGLSSLADIGVDYGRTCARTTGGDVFCWGDSEFGKAGDGRLPDNDGREKKLPGKAILGGASTLAVGSAHACSVMSDGRLSCWGQNHSGACGQPLRTRYLARPAFMPKTKDVASVSAGAAGLTCMVDRRGAVACWGSSAGGLLGPAGPNDDYGQRDTPVPIPLPAPAAEVAVGASTHVCARLTTGAVYCWGQNDVGQLGDGTTTARKIPAPVKGLARAQRIAVGLDNTCALVEGGRVFCWGRQVMEPDPSSRLEDALVPVEMTRAAPR